MRPSVLTPLLALTLTGVAIVGSSPPAGADVTTSVSGTTITVTATGNTYVGFGCGSGSNVTVNGTLVTPNVACSTLTKVTVNGDGGEQTVYGDYLDGTAFTAAPTLVASLGGGIDRLWDTSRADSFNLGDGNDYATIQMSTPNPSANMSNGTDMVIVRGSAESEQFTAISGSTNLLISRSNGATAISNAVTNAESLSIEAGPGNDTLTTTGVTAASSIDDITLRGEAGNDTLTNGHVFSHLNGGSGTNVMTSGHSEDYFESESDTDTIHDSGGQTWVMDQVGPRSGNRTLDVHGTTGTWVPYQTDGDAVMRIRPSTAPGTWATVTQSLNRPGQQVLPTNVNYIVANQSNGESAPDRSIFDVVVGTGDYVSASADTQLDDIADITIPAGEVWHTSGTVTGTYGVTTEDSSLMTVQTTSFGAVSVHHPWTDKDQGFVHRSNRDLLFRFIPEDQRITNGGAISGGLRTRAQWTATILGSDEYRGLDVDRVYVKYLRRAADPGGRTSWITSLRNGKPLWRFRAQLIGSNEYFNKAGGTNEDYMIQAYRDVMGRLPDPSGQTYWTNKLDNGANRGSVALQFLSSTEARRNIVKDQFLRFLDRQPTTAEASTWVSNLGSSPTGEQQLIAFLVNSNGYYDRS